MSCKLGFYDIHLRFRTWLPYAQTSQFECVSVLFYIFHLSIREPPTVDAVLRLIQIWTSVVPPIICFQPSICVFFQLSIKHNLYKLRWCLNTHNFWIYEFFLFPFFQNLNIGKWSRMEDDNRKHTFAFSSFLFSALSSYHSSAILVLLILWQCNYTKHVWFYITSPELYWIKSTSTIVHSSKLSIEDEMAGSFKSQNCHQTTEHLWCVDDITASPWIRTKGLNLRTPKIASSSTCQLREKLYHHSVNRTYNKAKWKRK